MHENLQHAFSSNGNDGRFFLCVRQDHGVRLILVQSEEWNIGEDDMQVSMLTSEDIEFNATFNTSCEQPGFTILFT